MIMKMFRVNFNNHLVFNLTALFKHNYMCIIFFSVFIKKTINFDRKQIFMFTYMVFTIKHRCTWFNFNFVWQTNCLRREDPSPTPSYTPEANINKRGGGACRDAGLYRNHW